MKKLLASLLLLSACALASAQALTTVSGTVTDSDGSLWIGATCSVAFVPSPTQPSQAQYFNQGVAVTTPSCNYVSGTASFSFSAGQSAVIAPSGSAWQLTLCPLASSPCQNYTFTATGASMSLSTALTAALTAPRFNCPISCYGYSTAEIVGTPTPGAAFTFSASGQTVNYTGTAWPGATSVSDFSTHLGSPTLGIIANSTRLWSFNFPTNIYASKLSWFVLTPDNTANLYDIGFYDATGNLVCHIGATAGTTFAPSANASVTATMLPGPCRFFAGQRYTFAVTGNAATAVLYGDVRSWLAIANVAPATGAVTSGGVLNNSITYGADNWNNSAGQPFISLHN